MHPLLGRLALGEWSLPLAPFLVLVAIGGLAALLMGWRNRRPVLLACGALACVTAVTFASRSLGARYEPAPFVVPSYGVMLALACLVLWLWTQRAASREGLPVESVRWVLAAAAGGALLGARLVYILVNGEPLARLPALGAGGLSGIGGLLGGLGAAAWACRVRGQSFFRILDAGAPALAFAVVAVRLGCYLHGCDFGTPLPEGAPSWLERLGSFASWSSMDLGVGPAALEHHKDLGWVPRSASLSLPVHPVQLYEASAGLVMLGLLWGMQARAPFFGARGLFAVGGYGLVSAALGPLHGDPERTLVSTLLLFALGLLCSALAWRQWQRQRVG